MLIRNHFIVETGGAIQLSPSEACFLCCHENPNCYVVYGNGSELYNECDYCGSTYGLKDISSVTLQLDN